MEVERGNIEIISELPQSVIIQDLSFDWAGKRIAAACSDKSVKIYQKKSEGWIEENVIKVQGASVWKVKWARPEFGIILATCSLDRHIRIWELKRVDKSQSEVTEWISIHSLQENKSVQDIKFTPNKSMGLCLAVACSDGLLKIYTAEDPLRLKEWGAASTIDVNSLGLNCLSWSKNQMKEDEAIIALGSKSIETSPKRMVLNMKNQDEESERYEPNASTVSFVLYNKSVSHKPLEKIQTPIKEIKAVNDISWALMNGRSYYLLGIAGDNFLKVLEINIKEYHGGVKVELLKSIRLSESASFRVSWNVMGTYISTSEKKRVRVWRAASRGNWMEVKEIQE